MSPTDAPDLSHQPRTFPNRDRPVAFPMEADKSAVLAQTVPSVPAYCCKLCGTFYDPICSGVCPTRLFEYLQTAEQEAKFGPFTRPKKE